MHFYPETCSLRYKREAWGLDQVFNDTCKNKTSCQFELPKSWMKKSNSCFQAPFITDLKTMRYIMTATCGRPDSNKNLISVKYIGQNLQEKNVAMYLVWSDLAQVCIYWVFLIFAKYMVGLSEDYVRH